MQQLAEERGKALEHVKDGAIFALNNRSSKALDRIYSAFQDYEKAHNADNKESGVLTGDRVHLNDAGNKFVAETILKTFGD